MTLATWGLIMIAVAITAYALNRFAKARAWLIFLGIMLAGLTGWLVTVMARVMAAVSSLVGVVGAKALGVSGGAVIAVIIVVLGFLFLHDVHPKGSGKKRTFWVAAILSLAITFAATPWAALNGLPASLRQATTTTFQG